MSQFVLLIVALVVVVAAGKGVWPQESARDPLLTPEYAEFWGEFIQNKRDTDVVVPKIRPVVRLSDGTKLQGITVENSNVNAFKGVRFAKAPVGNLRWAPPQKYVNPDTSVVVDAARYGASCVQGFPLSFIGEEDCLFLNVWSPADATAKSSLPVAVFVHGGSYNTGGGAMYSGAEMAEFYKGKAIVVTINYRLNAFGFLGSEMLRAQDPENGSTGNTGIQDQRMALQWIQENIAAFGGDKSRVMLFGESAGAGSVVAHLTNKKSWGLFSSAGVESGSFSSWIAQPMSQAQSKFDAFLATSGCNDLACLLSLSTEDVISFAASSVRGALPFLAYAPTADGVEMTTHPWFLLKEGQVADVPILHGTNLDETGIFDPIPKDANITQLEGYWNKMIFYYNYDYTSEDIAKLKTLYLDQVYPVTEMGPQPTQEWWSGSHSTGDVYFGCPARFTSKTLLSNTSRKSPTFQYHFQHHRNGMRFVSHFSEVPYVFNWNYLGWRRHQEDQDMADVMTTYWGNFIISNNPSSGDIEYDALPTWKAFSKVGEETILLPSKEGISVAAGIKQAECDFLIPIIEQSLEAAFQK